MAEMYSDRYLAYLENEKELKRNSILAAAGEVACLEQYLDAEGTRNIRDLMPSAYHDYLVRRTQRLSASSVRRMKSCLRSYFHFLHENSLISYYETFREETDAAAENAAIKAEKDASRQDTVPDGEDSGSGILNYRQLRALFEAPDDSSFGGIRDRAIMELMYSAALRPEELLQLRLSDLDLQLNICLLHQDDDTRTMAPFGDRAREALEAYMRIMKGSYTSREDILFVTRNGLPMSRQSLWKLIARHGKAAGIPFAVSAATLRRSFAAHLMDNGADPERVAAALGIRDPRYLAKKVFESTPD